MCYPTYRPGQEIIVLRGHEDCVASAAFSPDGARIVTASDDRTARIWDTVTAHEIALLRGHKDRMTRAAFSADGARIVTASDDHTARIWDTVTAHEIALLRGHKDWVTSAVFSPDGARILTASDDRTARIWSTKIGDESSDVFRPTGLASVAEAADFTHEEDLSRTVRQFLARNNFRFVSRLKYSELWHGPGNREVVVPSEIRGTASANSILRAAGIPLRLPGTARRRR